MISLTQMRAQLFTLADQVVATGEPVVVLRKGVRLRLIREDAAPVGAGRLSKLVQRNAVVGDPLSPTESPAQWSEAPPTTARTKRK